MANDIVACKQELANAFIVACNEVVAAGKAITQVNTDGELEIASELDTKGKKLIKQISAMRKAKTAPLDEEKKLWTAAEKQFVAPIEAEINRVNALMSTYATMKARRVAEEQERIAKAERERAEAMLQAEEDASKANNANALFGLDNAPAVPEAAGILPIIQPIESKAHASSSRFVEKWSFEIVNPAGVPRELCSPDSRKINTFLASKKAEGYEAEQLIVPGLRIASSIQVYSR